MASAEQTYKVGSSLLLHPAANDLPSLASPLLFKIKKQIAVRDDHRSQVVLAILETGPLCSSLHLKSGALDSSSIVAVKIFDPKFVDLTEEQPVDSPIDYCARLCKNEAETYQKLRSLSGVEVPIFYGTYTLDSNRLAIILEYINYGTLFGYQIVSDKEKHDLEAAGFSLIRKLHENGVYHGDVRRNNLFWSPSSQRLVIVDFEMAQFFEGRPEYVIKNWITMDKTSMEGVLEYCGARDPTSLPSFP